MESENNTVPYDGHGVVFIPSHVREIELPSGAIVRVARHKITHDEALAAKGETRPETSGYSGDGSRGFGVRILSPVLGDGRRTELSFSMTDNAGAALCAMLCQFIREEHAKGTEKYEQD